LRCRPLTSELRDLGSNAFSSTIAADALASMSRLTLLDISSNRFQGSVPRLPPELIYLCERRRCLPLDP